MWARESSYKEERQEKIDKKKKIKEQLLSGQNIERRDPIPPKKVMIPKNVYKRQNNKKIDQE
jgi:hypothetical protein